MFPIFLFILSLILVLFGLLNHQNGLFIGAGVMTLLVGCVTFLFVAGFISKGLQNILFAVFALLSVGLIYANYYSVDSEVQWRAMKVEKEAQVKQRMIDIRTAQLAYRNARGYYTDNFDSLKYFLATGTVMEITQFGDPTDSVQVANNQVMWDTTFVSVLDAFFLSPSALEKRSYPFFLDSLNIAPHENGAQFILNVALLSKGNLQVPAFLVVDPKPFDTKSDTLRLGSLSEATTNGNWKD